MPINGKVLVQWKGYGPEYDEWRVEDELKEAQGLIIDYWKDMRLSQISGLTAAEVERETHGSKAKRVAVNAEKIPLDLLQITAIGAKDIVQTMQNMEHGPHRETRLLHLLQQGLTSVGSTLPLQQRMRRLC